MAFLVLLMVAFAWLLGSVTRFALSDLRLPGVRPGSREPVIPPPLDGSEAPTIAAEFERAAEPGPDPEFDAERAVREHLYGRRERRV